MSWSHCGLDRQGRPIGYAIDAVCDHKDCSNEIDRGLEYVCGGMHGEDEYSCAKYFCPDHQEYTLELDDEWKNICEECMIRLTTSGGYVLCIDDAVIRPVK